MTVHFPLMSNTLKPKQKKLITAIADVIYPYDDVYVRNWDDFLSKFNLLIEVSNFSITAVDTDEVLTPFVNLKPVYMRIEFNCDNKMASYLKERTNKIVPGDKFIGVTPPISIIANGKSYTSFFVTEISVNPITWFGNDIPVFNSNNVEIKGYTFYKTNKSETIEFYDDEEDY